MPRPDVKICKQCGKDFFTGHKSGREFCSEKCKEEYNKRKASGASGQKINQ